MQEDGLLHSDKSLRIAVDWQQNADSSHSAALEIICNNQMGLLADLGAACKTLNINVNRMEGHSTDNLQAKLYLEISIKDVSTLQTLLRTLRKISGVVRVRRISARAS